MKNSQGRLEEKFYFFCHTGKTQIVLWRTFFSWCQDFYDFYKWKNKMCKNTLMDSNKFIFSFIISVESRAVYIAQ